ncbi:MAG TPA: hypothetical protein VHW71_17890 [Steroidobacteraceae bacterium]|jgi:hypothetical protein|nr:hypothetical protein [Steroidobacteraceae bacterium]
MRDLVSKLFAVPLVMALLAVAACSGSTVVTMTASPSSDAYIAYRVGLVSIQLKTSSGKPGPMLLPTETTVDFTKLLDLSEALGAPTVAKGTYTSAVITLDYSAALIIYDDGSLDGIALAPMASDGKALGEAIVTVALDPSDPIRSASKQAGRLSLNFDLAASNAIDLNANTVTVTPMITASIQPIDAKPVRIRGPLLGANANFFATGITPFDGTSAGLGQISITPSDTTTYEIDGFVTQGATGQAQLAALPSSTLTTVFGTLSLSDAPAGTEPTTPASPAAPGSPTSPPAATPVSAPGTATASSVTFTASQVQVDSSAQGFGTDQITGVVSARSNDTLGMEDAMLTQNGTDTFVPGTTIVAVGPNTLVTFFGQNVAAAISPQQISVGSVIEAFGTASNTSTGQMFLDASAGHVRLDLTTASGVVTAQASGSLTLNLATLGGRAISAFDFVGSGASGDQYGVATGALDLTNIAVGQPAVVTGFANQFATAAPNFTASTLLDPTTIQAELFINWSGTAAPFTSFDNSSIDLNVANGSIGSRHQIQVGAQIVNLVGLGSDPIITPNASASGAIFSIGHVSSSTVESFNSFADFITQLQSELNGISQATGMTVVGQYTPSSFAFSATSITLFLNN